MREFGRLSASDTLRLVGAMSSRLQAIVVAFVAGYVTEATTSRTASAKVPARAHCRRDYFLYKYAKVFSADFPGVRGN